MSKKNTQLFNLFNMMKAAGNKGVTKSQVSKQLGIAENSVPVYLFGLRKYFKAELENVKKGREIISYKLVNAADIIVPQHRKGSTSKSITKPLAKSVSKTVATKPVKIAKVSSNGEVATPDKDLHVSEITDREFNDIKSSLGLL